MIAMSFAQMGEINGMPNSRAVFFDQGWVNLPVIVPLVVGMGCGLLAGLINGSLIAYTGIPPFIATLGMMVSARGIAKWWTAGQPVSFPTESYAAIGAGMMPVIIFVVLAVLFWRRARGLEGHVRAAAQAVLEVLAAQRAEPETDDPLEQARNLFPGLGAPVRFELPVHSSAVGRSLAELELRSSTGATVLAIVRGAEGFAVPDAHAPLQPGDVLALAGTDEAIDAATALLER